MIEMKSATVIYPGTSTPAVDDFSFSFAPGKTTALVGPSGCGKTTLLRSVNRMVKLTSGSVLIDGKDVSTQDPVKLRRSIGYIMQNSGLLPHVTAINNVAAVARLNGFSKKESRDRAAQWLETVHVDSGLFDRYPAELSGGQAQRVGVARGLVADPDIVLMDEPFGAVDPVVRRELQEEVQRIQAKVSKTILMVTHDVDEAFYLGDEVVLLSENAHIEQAGPAQDLITAPANDTVAHFVGIEHRKVQITTREGRRVVLDARGNIIALVDQED